jgi:hypothetical protein
MAECSIGLVLPRDRLRRGAIAEGYLSRIPKGVMYACSVWDNILCDPYLRVVCSRERASGGMRRVGSVWEASGGQCGGDCADNAVGRRIWAWCDVGEGEGSDLLAVAVAVDTQHTTHEENMGHDHEPVLSLLFLSLSLVSLYTSDGDDLFLRRRRVEKAANDRARRWQPVAHSTRRTRILRIFAFFASSNLRRFAASSRVSLKHASNQTKISTTAYTIPLKNVSCDAGRAARKLPTRWVRRRGPYERPFAIRVAIRHMPLSPLSIACFCPLLPTIRPTTIRRLAVSGLPCVCVCVCVYVCAHRKEAQLHFLYLPSGLLASLLA